MYTNWNLTIRFPLKLLHVVYIDPIVASPPIKKNVVLSYDHNNPGV